MNERMNEMNRRGEWNVYGLITIGKETADKHEVKGMCVQSVLAQGLNG
jgi:hypothetical protein